MTLLDEKKFTAFQSIDDSVLVAYLNPHDTHIEAAFRSLAHRYKDRASFGFLETDKPSSVVCYRNKDDEQMNAGNLAAIGALPSFVEACIKPLIGEFSRRNELKYMQVRLSCFSGHFFYELTDLQKVRKVSGLLSRKNPKGTRRIC